METHDNQANIRRPRLHAAPRKIRALHSPDRLAIQERSVHNPPTPIPHPHSSGGLTLHPAFLTPKEINLTDPHYHSAHITHPELKVTVQLPIISVKKNPQMPLYTQLGVLTKGTIIEVNVSELGIVTTGGKVVWGRWAQITNSPENDGCVNGVLLV